MLPAKHVFQVPVIVKHVLRDFIKKSMRICVYKNVTTISLLKMVNVELVVIYVLNVHLVIFVYYVKIILKL